MSQYRLREIFESFNNLNVLIIGDSMIDSYYEGKVDRISPEAPVPIVAVSKRNSRLGGAANVALNIRALGAKPVLCSITGDDKEAEEFECLMKENELPLDGLIRIKDRPTTVKTRVIGNNHQLIRVDFETDEPLKEADHKKVLNRALEIIKKGEIDVIIFEDYDKGILNKALIEKVVEVANSQKIPTAVDPKKRNFDYYRGVTLFKPNFKELKEGLKDDFLTRDTDEIALAVKKLHSRMGNENTFVTLSSLGVIIQGSKEQHYFPAHIRDIADVSGAGDTVISVAALCLALNEDISTLANLANLAGGLVCEKVGVVPIDKNQLLQEAISLTIN